MSVSASPRATTTAPMTNTPSVQARYRTMTIRKKMAATQVSAVTNSYMLPQGARCTASPLVTTATVWATTPTAASAMAAWTHGPAWRMARSGGTACSGMDSGAAEAGTADAGTAGAGGAAGGAAASDAAAGGVPV